MRRLAMIFAYLWPVHLQRQIETLKQKILFVGTLVEEAIAKAISALMNRDRNLARSVIDEDAEIDRMEVDVEEECLKTLALYQPVAADLRFVVAVLKINNDLERMGDLAKNIAKRVMFLTQCERIDLPADFRSWPPRRRRWSKQSLDALVNSRHGAGPHRSATPTMRSIACGAIIQQPDRTADRASAQANRVFDAADQRLAAPGTAGRHGHQHRRRRDLYGRGRNRPASGQRLIACFAPCRCPARCPALAVAHRLRQVLAPRR